MAKRSRLLIRFGQRCRQLRRSLGLSQLDMVRQFDFSLSHYQKIERGDLDARLTTLQRLANCFGISLSELLEEVSPAAGDICDGPGPSERTPTK